MLFVVFLQGAGEPMDLGELAGMTPEIIQKVRNIPGLLFAIQIML